MATLSFPVSPVNGATGDPLSVRDGTRAGPSPAHTGRPKGENDSRASLDALHDLQATARLRLAVLVEVLHVQALDEVPEGGELLQLLGVRL